MKTATPGKQLTFPFPLFLTLFLLAFWLTAPYAAQAKRRMFWLTSDQKKVQVPIKLLDNLVVVTGYLNQETPVNLILDTGTPAILLTDPRISRKLLSPGSKEVTFAGPGNGGVKIKGTVLSNQSLRFPGIEGKELGVVATKEPLGFLKKLGGTPIHGILGYPFFTQFVVTIDYANELLTITEPGYFFPDSHTETLPFSLGNSKPILHTILFFNSEEFSSRLMIDTGASYALLLSHGSPAGRAVTPSTHKTRLGVGFGGEIVGRKGTIPFLQVSHIALSNITASLPEKGQYSSAGFVDRDGSIGGGLLSKFVVTFDYQAEKVYLKRNRSGAIAYRPGRKE
jgi:hypothetical protein